MTTIRSAIAVVALTASAVLGITTVGAAERVTSVSQGTLAARGAAVGGASYGTAGASGCTKNHPDGSADSFECGRRSGCVHVHSDPPLVSGSAGGTGRVVTATR